MSQNRHWRRSSRLMCPDATRCFVVCGLLDHKILEARTMPKVSVVIPLYQTERFIADTVRSVLSQTFTDFEIIVIDDESSDSGPAIARSVDDSRIRVIRQENRGLAGARNSGIRNALGEY